MQMKVCEHFDSFSLISLVFLLLFHLTFSMHYIFLSFLGFFARTIIQFKKPFIIWVTGTVGKTTVTTHIATFLVHEFGESAVMFSPYHYNGEYGLPLSIIWARTGGKNPFLWIWVFMIAISRLFRSYPQYLILEYGIDHPGEMEFLLSIAHPDIAVILPITANHLEQFWTLESYRNAKLLLWRNAKKLIAYDWLRQYIDRDTLYYSMGGMSDIDASHMHMSIEWVSAQVHVKESNYVITIPAFWAYQVENVLPVYGIAFILGIDPTRIGECSHSFLPEAGRSSILSGKGSSVIIDGSYNGGYESICRGIDSVLPFWSSHRILFLLWDMRELGQHEAEIHRSLFDYISEHVGTRHDIRFFLVWPLMQQYLMAWLQENYITYHSLSSREMGIMIENVLLEEKDRATIVYVKGSQNTIFLEEGIKKFLALPTDEKLLCRQSSDWMRKKKIFFSKFELID